VLERDQSLTTGQLPVQHHHTAAVAAAQPIVGHQAGQEEGREVEVNSPGDKIINYNYFAFQFYDYQWILN